MENEIHHRRENQYRLSISTSVAAFLLLRPKSSKLLVHACFQTALCHGVQLLKFIVNRKMGLNVYQCYKQNIECPSYNNCRYPSKIFGSRRITIETTRRSY